MLSCYMNHCNYFNIFKSGLLQGVIRKLLLLILVMVAAVVVVVVLVITVVIVVAVVYTFVIFAVLYLPRGILANNL